MVVMAVVAESPLGSVAVLPARSLLYSTCLCWACGEILRLATSGLHSGSKAGVLFSTKFPNGRGISVMPIPEGLAQDPFRGVTWQYLTSLLSLLSYVLPPLPTPPPPLTPARGTIKP